MHRLLLAILVIIPFLAGAQTQGLPSHRYVSDKALITEKFLGSEQMVAHELVLAAPTETEKAKLRRANEAPRKNRPLKIGFTRAMNRDPIALSALQWQMAAQGRVARIKLTSATAAGIRMQMSFQGKSEGIEFRFKGAARDQVFGPISATALATQTQFWSPVMEGEAGVVEILAGESAVLEGAALTISSISHLLVAGADLHPQRIKAVADIGRSDNCEIDIACVLNPSQALLAASAAVTHYIFSDSRGSYMCTGTLLNSVYLDGRSTQNPYLFTANHCMLDQALASTIVTYWFFEAAICNSLSVPPNYVVVGGGATLLLTDRDTDVAFLRLNRMPPSGAMLAGSNPNPVDAATPVIVLHHPKGDLKKFSQGMTQGYDYYDSSRSARFITVKYSNGSTEGGSSGAGVFTYSDAYGYQLRGGLLGGDAACSNMSGLDYFSPMHLRWTELSEYLLPNTYGSLPQVVEYYNPDLNRFFLTMSPDEQNLVDSQAVGNWHRTGNTFSPGGTSPVCRFYGNKNINPATGLPYGPNSHFYTVSPAECAFWDVRYDPSSFSWQIESYNAFLSTPSDFNKNCPPGLLPVYRAYNRSGDNPNHRFTTNYSAYLQTVAAGWLGEGALMCAPR